MLGLPPIESWSDITALGKEVVARGFTALKTNIVLPGKAATSYHGFDGSMGADDEWAPNWLGRAYRDADRHVSRYHGRGLRHQPRSQLQLQARSVHAHRQALELHNLHWLEIDRYDPDALLQIKQSTSTRICTGETLIHMQQYSVFERHAADVFMIDVPWNGFAQVEEDRRSGRYLPAERRTPQLLQPSLHVHEREPVRDPAQRADHGDRHRRRAVEG